MPLKELQQRIHPFLLGKGNVGKKKNAHEGRPPFHGYTLENVKNTSPRLLNELPRSLNGD
ncbi:MAG: hypothetical protein C4326_06725 [Ignavibacteria bacterium]